MVTTRLRRTLSKGNGISTFAWYAFARCTVEPHYFGYYRETTDHRGVTVRGNVIEESLEKMRNILLRYFDPGLLLLVLYILRRNVLQLLCVVKL